MKSLVRVFVHAGSHSVGPFCRSLLSLVTASSSLVFKGIGLAAGEVFAPKALRLATKALSVLSLFPRPPQAPKIIIWLGNTFRSILPAEIFLYSSALAIRTFIPEIWRSIEVWRMLLPIYAGYMRTKFETANKGKQERDLLWGKRHEWGGERVYNLVLKLSGFYVKSAQILASQSDSFPAAWTRRLATLFDKAPPRPFTEVSISIQKQLALSRTGKELLTRENSKELPLDAVFAYVEPVALAAASIAQVHTAELLEGRRHVVIKVQHLGMDKLMAADMRNIGKVSTFLNSQLPFDLSNIVKEIQATIPLEFDFHGELEYMLSIQRNLISHSCQHIVCPEPVEDLCTKQMIVMTHLEGIPFSEIISPGANSKLQGLRPQAAASFTFLLDAFGFMLFVDGCFHADPHPGNLLLLPDGRLGLLDFGQCKRLDAPTKTNLAKIVVAIVEGDPFRVAQAICEAGMEFGIKKGDPVKNVSKEQVGKGKVNNLETFNGHDTKSGRPNEEDCVSYKSQQDALVGHISTIANILFDTRNIPEAQQSPLAEDSILRLCPVVGFNRSLWLIVRAILLLRGICYALNLDVSAAKIWLPHAQAVLEHNTKAGLLPVSKQ